jgi:hypothetical protein
MTPASPTPLERFRASMAMDLDRWRDGEGYDLAALAEANDDERRTIESWLLAGPSEDRRDIEALAALGTEAAIQRLRSLAAGSDQSMALAVIALGLSDGGDCVTPERAAERIAETLDRPQSKEALRQATDCAERHHPPIVLDAIVRRLRDTDRVTAYDLVALLLTLCGRAESRWDMDRRPEILDRVEAITGPDDARREAAIADLLACCASVANERRE